jgi:hypothetical protein
MAWHAVQVTFPPDTDVNIERRFRVRNGVQVHNVHFLKYSIATGGVWHDSIKRLEASVELKEGLTIEDLDWPSDHPDQNLQISCSPDKGEWQIRSPTG